MQQKTNTPISNQKTSQNQNSSSQESQVCSQSEQFQTFLENQLEFTSNDSSNWSVFSDFSEPQKNSQMEFERKEEALFDIISKQEIKPQSQINLHVGFQIQQASLANPNNLSPIQIEREAQSNNQEIQSNNRETPLNDSETNHKSIGKNIPGAFRKSCKTCLRKKIKLYDILYQKGAFVERHFILPLASRAHIISFPAIVYFLCKDQLKSNQQKTIDLVKEIKSQKQSYNRKNENNFTQEAQGNTLINLKIIKFLGIILENIKMIENKQWIRQQVIDICFLTKEGKNKNKEVCREQIDKLYSQLQKKDYAGIFQAQKNELQITY